MSHRLSSAFQTVFLFILGIFICGAAFIRNTPLRVVCIVVPAIGIMLTAVSALRKKGPVEIQPSPCSEVQVPEITKSIADEEEKADTTPTVSHEAARIIAGMSQVLPVLAGQLKAVIEHTEQAAMDLSQSFFRINAKAKEQVRDVQDIFRGISGEKSQTGALYDIRDNLNSLSLGLEQLLRLIERNVDSTERIVKQSRNIEDIVNKSNEITEISRVLSINATIEAARAGQHGRGFAVVASEFKKMTEKSETATEEIQEIVEMISKLGNSIHAETRESVEMSRQLGDKVKSGNRESVEQIDTMINRAVRDLEKVGEKTQALAADISSIVMSIQFQDITRQRIEHVIEPLKEFGEDLQKLQDLLENSGSPGDFASATSGDFIDRLTAKYTMAEEKKVAEATLS